MSLAERFADDISLEYSLIDRMRIRGHVLNLQTITMLRTYFQRVHHVDWIEPENLQRLTDDFVRFVEDYAKSKRRILPSARDCRPAWRDSGRVRLESGLRGGIGGVRYLRCASWFRDFGCGRDVLGRVPRRRDSTFGRALLWAGVRSAD